jgi:hypothetical protein
MGAWPERRRGRQESQSFIERSDRRTERKKEDSMEGKAKSPGINVEGETDFVERKGRGTACQIIL